jgi:hypothetical protein
VDEHAVIRRDLLRRRLDLPRVRDFDRAAERGAHPVEAHLRHDVVHGALLAAGTAGEKRSGHGKAEGERVSPGTSESHLECLLKLGCGSRTQQAGARRVKPDECTG